MLVALMLACFASIASAQVTTATIRGTVTSSDDATPMTSVEVTLVHVPTGNTKTTTTNDAGAFVFTGLRVGGPYRITAAIDEERAIYLSAGKTRDVPLGLKLAEAVIEVAGSSISHNTSERTIVTSQEIEALPSVSRDPRDLYGAPPMSRSRAAVTRFDPRSESAVQQRDGRRVSPGR